MLSDSFFNGKQSLLSLLNKHFSLYRWIWLAGTAIFSLGIFFIACSTGSDKLPAAQFELINQRGETVSLSEFQGKTVLLTFLYTYCPDTCPLYIAKMNQAMYLNPSIQDKLVVLVVTVDPERDTHETLKSYTGRWPSNWHYLFGDTNKLKTIWENYGITVQKKNAQQDSHDEHMGYSVIHTAKIVLIDAVGNKVTELKGNWQAQELVQKLQATVEGKSVSGPSFSQSVVSFLFNCGSIAFENLGQAITHAVTMLAIVGALVVVALVLWR